ncbi:hypothetical protein AB0I49_01100 [Streptomyces sp. NPDC050617]|uniref:hypothetical protein n=1 Tax=Streptomyces sp. NPDC050617 TaxID=3154628 RepID=UPI0034128921
MNGEGIVTVRIAAGQDYDAQELTSLARGLRRELLELDVKDVELAASEHLPAGAKGLSAAVGTLLVRMGVSVAVRHLVEAVRRWAARDAVRSAEIEIDGVRLNVTGISDDQQKQLIDVYLERLGSRP